LDTKFFERKYSSSNPYTSMNINIKNEGPSNEFEVPLLPRRKKPSPLARVALILLLFSAFVFIVFDHFEFNSEIGLGTTREGKTPTSPDAPGPSGSSPQKQSTREEARDLANSPQLRGLSRHLGSQMQPPSQVQPRVVVIGSINIDLYKKVHRDGSITFSGGKKVDISSVKGMTLPYVSFFQNQNILPQLTEKGLHPAGYEVSDGLVWEIDGPLTQMTGGKGANAASAACQTFSCQFIGQLGEQSHAENVKLLQDLKTYGNVDVSKLVVKEDIRTGSAFIFSYFDGDNSIVLVGGANMDWPSKKELSSSGFIQEGIQGAVAIMLQREIPEYVNQLSAQVAKELGIPTIMDVGGTDAPLDPDLIPFISLIVPNESELTFITGVETKSDGKIRKQLIREAVWRLKQNFAQFENHDVEVLVTLGSCGSIYFASHWQLSGEENSDGLLNYETYAGCFPLDTVDEKPVDTTGAGDCYRGSFVAARYGDSKPTFEAMRWASAASSLAVQVKGAMPSMPNRESIEARITGTSLEFRMHFKRWMD